LTPMRPLSTRTSSCSVTCGASLRSARDIVLALFPICPSRLGFFVEAGTGTGEDGVGKGSGDRAGGGVASLFFPPILPNVPLFGFGSGGDLNFGGGTSFSSSEAVSSSSPWSMSLLTFPGGSGVLLFAGALAADRDPPMAPNLLGAGLG